MKHSLVYNIVRCLAKVYFIFDILIDCIIIAGIQFTPVLTLSTAYNII